MKLTSQKTDFSKWYLETVKKADLMSYAPVRGCMTFKPASYALWEKIKELLDQRFKATGHENAYFPMLIPESLLKKETNHIEGFNPELPWVTEAAGKKLEERLAIRPTSETIIGHMYSQWIKSYRDLPLLLNQWCNVIRWEKRTLPFIRTTEFLWQEGHTAHATKAEAEAETLAMLEIYQQIIEQKLAIPCWPGRKTPLEKFAGACDTYSIELMLKDGKALQAATSHFMGTNFAKAFEIKFLDQNNNLEYAYTTSWGTTTRLIGALIMAHGDDKGLIIPPEIAPTQVIIVPVGPAKSAPHVHEAAEKLKQELTAAKILVKTDLSLESAGWKFNEWELRGIPLRIEIGPRDLEKQQLVLARRDTGEKQTIPSENSHLIIKKILSEIQTNLFSLALERQEKACHVEVECLADLKKETDFFGWVLGGWCGDNTCEEKIKAETSFTARNIPTNPPCKKEYCFACGSKSKATVWYARAY
ncbi:MAG: hypothetical protein RLZ12_624 [Bacillota bacterium]